MGQGVVDGDRRPARRGVRPRNGPPLAVSTMRRELAPGRRSLARRHWWTAQCSVSTGTSSAPGRRAAAAAPPARRRSATPCWPSARRLPAASAASVTGSPAKPTTPFTTTSASSARSASASARHAPRATGSASPRASAASRRRRRPRRPSAGARAPGSTSTSTDDARAEGDDLVAVGLGAHDVEGLGADRAGRAGDGDTTRRSSRPRLRPAVRTHARTDARRRAGSRRRAARTAARRSGRARRRGRGGSCPCP